jgi:predicted transcriptional regulator
VIDVATLNVIRRWALRDQMSIREISRRTGLARNTVKKHLRSEESEPKYPRRVSSSKLDPYAEKLATWLGIEATKSRKQRRTLRQIHTDSAQKGENQELIHTVSTFCSQRVWVNIRWKTRVRLQCNSTYKWLKELLNCFALARVMATDDNHRFPHKSPLI